MNTDYRHVYVDGWWWCKSFRKDCWLVVSFGESGLICVGVSVEVEFGVGSEYDDYGEIHCVC